MAIIAEFVAGRTPPELYQAYLSPLFETWSNALVEALPPKGRVLDVACGTGIVSRKLAVQAGVDQVVGIDIAPPMIEAASSQSGEGAPIEFCVASADQIAYPDCHFRFAYCQQGLQFFPDKAAALNELARLLSPGGKAAFAVWTSANDGNPAFGAFESIVAAHLGEDLVPFGPFSFGESQLIEDVVGHSDLRLVSLEKEDRLAQLPDPRTLVLFDLLFLGRPGPDGTMHPLFDPQDSSKDEQVEQIIAELESACRPYIRPDGGLLAPSSAHIVVLEKS